MTDEAQSRDARYVDIILERVRVSAAYKPKFGRGGRSGLTLWLTFPLDFLRSWNRARISSSVMS